MFNNPDDEKAYDQYHARYDYDMQTALTALFDEYMPADDSQVARKLLIQACYDHARWGGRQRQYSEIELRRLILYHLTGVEGNTARYALDTYLRCFE